MKEHHIEGYLLDQVIAAGGFCIKLTPMGDNGWPDRLVILPGNVIGFLELKRPGEEPTPLQLHRIERLAGLRCIAGWASSFAEVDAFMDRLTGREPIAPRIAALADKLAAAR